MFKPILTENTAIVKALSKFQTYAQAGLQNKHAVMSRKTVCII